MHRIRATILIVCLFAVCLLALTSPMKSDPAETAALDAARSLEMSLLSRQKLGQTDELAWTRDENLSDAWPDASREPYLPMNAETPDRAFAPDEPSERRGDGFRTRAGCR